jgi:L-arabinokinase
LNDRSTVVFYISGHGFGHASRAIEVINALLALRPELRVIIRSSVAAWLVARTAHPSVQLDRIEVDTGVVQIDSLHLDAPASIARAEAFMSTFDQRVAGEAAYLRQQHAVLTVSDLPPLGIAAAGAAGIPAIAFGNFTWDWIYEHYDGGQDVANRIADVYRDAALALRLPMWGGFAAMPVIRDLPFVARRSKRDPLEVRRALAIPVDARAVLVSFGGYGLQGLDTDALRRLDDYDVLLPGMIDEAAMYDRGYRYEDLVGAVDVVATKPGYGIISECLANDTALLYTSRGDFREYQVMVDAIPAFLRCEFIDHPDLFAGNWGRHLDAVLAQPAPPTRPATNGAEVAADILSRLIA